MPVTITQSKGQGFSDEDSDDSSRSEENEVVELDEDGDAVMDGSRMKNVVTPGELVTSNPQFMRGHGTYVRQQNVYATVAGMVQRVNKLISVKPIKARYHPEIGDLVVGRISDVGPKRWRVDIGARQDAVLMLSSINLPGGILRRKSESDELQMRYFFQEGDLLVAEIQAQFSDGAASLHTRSLKYGKLRNGRFLSIPPSLIIRSAKSHAHTFPGGVDAILGVNGYLWISKHNQMMDASGVSITRLEEEASEAIYSNVNDDIDAQTMSNISRISNCIQALAANAIPMSESIIAYAYEESMEFDVGDILRAEAAQRIAQNALAQSRR